MCDSIVHSGEGWGINIYNSHNIDSCNTAVIGFKQLGFNVDKTEDVTLSNIFISNISYRDDIDYLDGGVERQGGLAVCSWSNPSTGSVCYRTKITDVTVSGVIGFGIIAPSYACNYSGSKMLYNNYVHSIRGIGGHIFPDPNDASTAQCYEIDRFHAYKVQGPALATYFRSGSLKVRDSTFIDNLLGVSLQLGGETDDGEIDFIDNYLYGESSQIAQDCPNGAGDPNAFTGVKTAFTFAGFNIGSKWVYPDHDDLYPFIEPTHPSAWYGFVNLVDNHFIDF